MFAINQLVKHHISGAPVVDGDGKLVGMLSAMDCMQVGLIAAEDTCVAGPVSQFMKGNVVSVSPDDSLTHLAQLFLSKPFRRYPVMENGKLVGQISRSDVLRAINAMC
jgi:CBS domain-containing protein